MNVDLRVVAYSDDYSCLVIIESEHISGFVSRDLFVTDSDCESYTGVSDSEDQEESEFKYSDHAQSILPKLG